ncbi:MAG TPA: hypothetical protein VE972_00610 [Conexibacter sp.]|nr:hypothetical protein [Conexibacter sp.]
MSIRSVFAIGMLTIALCVGSTTSASAFDIAGFDTQPTGSGGSLYTQAGGHPDALATQIRFTTTTVTDASGNPVVVPDEPVKEIKVDAPPGLIGNPASLPKCTIVELTEDDGPFCPAASQVGTVTVTLTYGRVGTFPLYNMTTPPDAPARFGFFVLGTMVLTTAQVRTGSDFGVSFIAHNTSEGTGLLAVETTFWGVPADPSHDDSRVCPGNFGSPPCTTDAPRVPFLRLPTSCPASASQGEPWSLAIASWFHPTTFLTRSIHTHLAPGLPDGLPEDQWGPQQGVTGCADLPFDPSLSVQPTEPASPGPSGYTFDLTLPQNEDPDQLGESDLRKAVVTLPEGVRVNPSSAGGLGACSPAQIALKSTTEPTCPDSSKIGVLKIDTPLLEKPLDGAVYLATPHDNPSNSLIAIYLVAKGPGLVIKLAGGVSPSSSADGQLKATFDNLPQTPFSNMHLEFFGGDRAALSNPPKCGTYTTRAVLTGWSGKTVISDSSFTTTHDGHGAPCPKPQFKPTFAAGTTNPVAGKHAPLSVTISRSDDDEEIGGIDAIQLPDGLLAKLAGIKMCSGTDARAGTCGAGSRIGSVTAAAGSGSDPFAVSGTVYLGGKYKGAPFSLVFEVPVIAGPFDLGQITIRSALYIDRHNATAKVATDPLPTILQGIPLQVRLVNVTIDRKGFAVNPTSCAAKQITGAIRSSAGTVAHVRDRFQVLGCAGLGFHPDFSITVGGKGHTSKGSSTALKTVLKMPRGGANLKSVDVSLPLSLSSLLNVVNDACTRAEFEAGHCEQARAGSATAITPLLAHGLRGGVYFVKDPDKPAGSLPNLIVALRGQVAFDLVGTIRIPHGTTLATKFTTVPDVPVKKFVLSLVSGSHSPLAAAENLCSKSARRKTASLTFKAQNGLVIERRQHLHVAGCGRR